jgi:hypothetical protein
MVELTDTEIDAALARGEATRHTEPRAASVRYDPVHRRVIAELTNGCSFAFPPESIQGLGQASDAELASVKILGAGYGLHWDQFDIDISVPGLLAGIFGTRAFMAQQAGRISTPKKAAAARANGSKGGRPRKAAI